MKPLLLFDVDGTLAESGKSININILNILTILSAKYDIGIVGGGTHSKIVEQINYSNIFTHIFSECGCVYHKYNNNNYELIYKKNIRSHQLYNSINILIKVALEYISKVDYTITGHFIDLRNGLVYVSLIGMVALDEERKYFIDIDKKQNIRKKLIDILIYKTRELGIHDKIKILEGGSVGICIYPAEHDKSQVLDTLNNYTDISYFGDKYTEDGNDYELITHSNVKGYSVNSPIDTLNILKTLISH
jgi:phosphomannomutase